MGCGALGDSFAALSSSPPVTLMANWIAVAFGPSLEGGGSPWVTSIHHRSWAQAISLQSHPPSQPSCENLFIFPSWHLSQFSAHIQSRGDYLLLLLWVFHVFLTLTAGPT